MGVEGSGGEGRGGEGRGGEMCCHLSCANISTFQLIIVQKPNWANRNINKLFTKLNNLL